MISYSLEPQGDYIPLEGAEFNDTGAPGMYIRLEDNGTIRQARFYLNDSLVQTANRAPYALKGTNVFGRPRVATFPDGQHSIRVEIDHRDGQTYEESSWFTVGSPETPDTGSTIPVTVSVDIGGQTLAVMATVVIDGDGNVTDIS